MAQLRILVLALLFVLPIYCSSEYKVVNATQSATNITLQLQYFGKDDFYVKPSSPIIKKAQFIIQCLTSNEFYFKITDSQTQRFEVLSGVQPFPQDTYEKFSYPLSACEITFIYNENPFYFTILRAQSKAVLFSTSDSNFIFSSYYIEIGTEVASNKIFGLGQRFSVNFRKGDGKWTVFNRAGDQEIDYGTGNNTYGYYPFYLLIDSNQEGHISYLKSTNAMDVFKTEQNNKHYLTYKIVGGVLNFRFSLGDSNVLNLISRFQNYVIGKSAIPPFWSLGFHQSRWGYESVSQLKQVISKYKSYRLPLDTIWSDIDYMDDFQDFTVDQENFPLNELKEITDEFHYVPIIDAGVSIDSQAYQIGKEQDVFIKDLRGKQYVGLVWPGNTAFVDYFHPNSTKYWMQMLESLYQKVKFSGVWLDMNQIENFCDGPCSIPTEPPIIDYSNDIPYHPGSHLLQFGTISLNVTHYQNISEFNVHPYFALMEVYATHKFLKTKSKFPFILSRSTTFGSNKFGFHWTGDNHASWQFLRSSVVDNMNMNLAGIQMVGPDICGFGGDTNQELCARWYQLAAVYPFARSHNDYWSIPQQPYSMGGSVLNSAYDNLKLRYMFLKQFYNFMISANPAPFFTSLAYYPQALKQITDIQLYDRIVSTQFLIANSSLMIVPILEQGKTSREFFLPNLDPNGESQWTYLYTRQTYKSGLYTLKNVKIDAMVPIFMRLGDAYFINNVVNVTKTSQLDSDFTIFAVFKLESNISGIETYVSQGSILSLDDYSNEDKLETYIANQAKYNVYLRITYDRVKPRVAVNIRSSYTYAALRDPIYVPVIIMIFDGMLGEYDLPEKLEIRENVDTTYVVIADELRREGNIMAKLIGKPQNQKNANLQMD